MHTHAHSYLNRFFTEITACLKMSDKLRNKYTVINHHLGKFQSHRMFPITWRHNQMCVLMSLMPLEKWRLLLTLVSYKVPQILYNSRYIQSHPHHARPAIQLFICAYASAQLPLYRFPWNLIVGPLMKICQKNPNLVKIGQESQELYLKI